MDLDYGRQWPEDTPQIVKELHGFRADGNEDGFLSRFEHALNIIRLQWPDDVIIEKEVNGKTYVNSYFLRVLKACCEKKTLGLTGSASTGKTYACAVYALICFYADPQATSVIISTTSSTASTRRIWSDIKKLFFDSAFPIGNCIDYLKCIVFDPGEEIEGKKDAASRDMRNGIMVVPIGKGAEGKGALATLIGTKNKNVIWIIDELPEMDDGILKPVANLISNSGFQLIGIGNAKSRTDPHGVFCEPKDGWGTEQLDEGEWETRIGHCVFLDGEKSPNIHPELNELPDDKLPFDGLISYRGLKEMARFEGAGDITQGKLTHQYLRFGRGIWPDESIDKTILSRNIVTHYQADQEVIWNYKQIVHLCGCDPSFSADGDKFCLMFGTMGQDEHGNIVLMLDKDVYTVPASKSDGEDFLTQMALKVINSCERRGVTPDNFAIDAGHDGGIMGQTLMRLWGSHEITLLSSLGKPTQRIVAEGDYRDQTEAYDRAVTAYWYNVRRGVMSGHIKGFNPDSRYAFDMFRRLYIPLKGNKVSIETKRDMKKRLGRSPDYGDALAYLVEIAIQKGLNFSYDPTQETGYLTHPQQVYDQHAQLKIYEQNSDVVDIWEEANDVVDAWEV